VFHLLNQTPFHAQLLPTLDADGGEAVMVLVKGTYTFEGDAPPRLAGEQLPAFVRDVYWGDPATSPLKYASDLVPEKQGTDVVLIGSANPPAGGATEIDVALEAGPLRKTVRVFGDRNWKRVLGVVSFSTKPAPLVRMPLTYDRAFGGADKTHADQKQWKVESRNPVGRGLIANSQRPDFTEVPLPNIENPDALLKFYQETPAPTGFGFIAPTWEPRKKHAGTYDAAWQESRCPLLPADFSSRYYNAAHPDLVSKEFFQGGEKVRITNVRKTGPVAFSLPNQEVAAEFFIDGAVTRKTCDLDTVVIETDDNRLLLTWRAKVRCHRKMKFVTGARVTTRDR
jgi:hypothetical protein